LKACEGVEGGLALFVGEGGGVGFFHPRPYLAEGAAQGGACGLFYTRSGGVSRLLPEFFLVPGEGRGHGALLFFPRNLHQFFLNIKLRFLPEGAIAAAFVPDL
jgi:hypothetical protein